MKLKQAQIANKHAVSVCGCVCKRDKERDKRTVVEKKTKELMLEA